MASAETHYIRTWNASLFESSSHKWVYGHLNLSSSAISFKSSVGEGKNLDENSHSLYINFSNITSINKALSSLVFPAITIIIKDGNVVWLSSFENRNSTFLILQHFYQSSLHQTPITSAQSAMLRSSATAQKRTQFGTDLLQSIVNSQATLQKAAGNLVEQGQQLRNASFTIEELHDDLTVAERITGGLDSWLGRWALPPTQKMEDLILVTRNDIPDVFDLEVLYTPVTATKIGIQLIGVFRVAKEGITILDLKQKVVQYFKWSDISRIRVVSPWEIHVTRFLIGQPDLSYDILSMDMPKVLKKLNIFAARKMEYMNPPEKHHKPHFEHLSEQGAHRPNQTMTHSDSNGETTPTFGYASCIDGADSHLQQQEQAQQELITDSEVLELSAALSDLKNLALDIQIEQGSQLETIDRLTDSVTRGSDRLKVMNLKIDKLAK
uniref:Synaptosomal-associated protein 47 n=1 Tax=Arion vulgaris TaxID=1028688 RepID=A0A0B6ZQ09_9EUPU